MPLSHSSGSAAKRPRGTTQLSRRFSNNPPFDRRRTSRARTPSTRLLDRLRQPRPTPSPLHKDVGAVTFNLVNVLRVASETLRSPHIQAGGWPSGPSANRRSPFLTPHQPGGGRILSPRCFSGYPSLGAKATTTAGLREDSSREDSRPNHAFHRTQSAGPLVNRSTSGSGIDMGTRRQDDGTRSQPCCKCRADCGSACRCHQDLMGSSTKASATCNDYRTRERKQGAGQRVKCGASAGCRIEGSPPGTSKAMRAHGRLIEQEAPK